MENQEPKQNLSDLQFVASLQHQIDELQSLINNDMLNIINKDNYREYIEVDTKSNHEVVSSFIRFVHLRHPFIIRDFIEYLKS